MSTEKETVIHYTVIKLYIYRISSLNFFLKKGRKMRKVNQIVLFLLICTTFIFAKDVLVKGTVKSFATGDVIDGAAVFALGINMTAMAIPDSVDTFYTNASGYFEKTIQVEDGDNTLIFGAQKENYLVKTDMKAYLFTSIPSEVDLGDVLLKTIDDASDTLKVSGVVLDSITNLPVSGATVMITSGVIGDITIDSLTTNDNGEFQGAMPYIPGENALFNFLLYSVSKDKYNTKADTSNISENGIIDLGDIFISPIITPITKIFNNGLSIKPTHFTVYSLQGKKIYSGTMRSYARFKKSDFSNQQFIIKYFKNGNLLAAEKVLKK